MFYPYLDDSIFSWSRFAQGSLFNRNVFEDDINIIIKLKLIKINNKNNFNVNNMIIMIPIKNYDNNNNYNKRIKYNLNGLQHESPIPCQRTIGVLQNILSAIFMPKSRVESKLK